ncbi:hypothetical protein ACNKHN_08660 [Shigella flexneri]
MRNGSTAIAGVVAEKFALREGTQKIVAVSPLTYGQSITDPCLARKIKRLVEKLAYTVDTRF